MDKIIDGLKFYNDEHWEKPCRGRKSTPPLPQALDQVLEAPSVPQ